MTISLGRSQYPFAGGGGKAHTQAGPPSTTAVTARSQCGRYHTGRQRAVTGLVYVLPIAVVENVGAAVLAVVPFGG
jgi:hypothetical protein